MSALISLFPCSQWYLLRGREVVSFDSMESRRAASVGDVPLVVECLRPGITASAQVP